MVTLRDDVGVGDVGRVVSGVMWERWWVGDVGGVRNGWCGWGWRGRGHECTRASFTHNWDHIAHNSAHWLFTCLLVVYLFVYCVFVKCSLWHICLVMDMFVFFLCIWCVCACVYLHTYMLALEWVKRHWGFNVKCLLTCLKMLQKHCQPCAVQQPLDSVDHSVALWLSAIIEWECHPFHKLLSIHTLTILTCFSFLLPQVSPNRFDGRKFVTVAWQKNQLTWVETLSYLKPPRRATRLSWSVCLLPTWRRVPTVMSLVRDLGGRGHWNCAIPHVCLIALSSPDQPIQPRQPTVYNFIPPLCPPTHNTIL